MDNADGSDSTLTRSRPDAVGLCASCRHARVVESARQSRFWHCGRATHDARFSKYPRLPVHVCDGFEKTTAKLPPVAGRCAVAWSGGKDSCLAWHQARLSGYAISGLLTLHGDDGLVRFHGVDGRLIEQQARALGCEAIRVQTTPATYERHFEAALLDLRRRDIAGLIFGNVHLADVQAWFEDRTRQASLAHVEPLWGWTPRDVCTRFLALGYRAVVVSVMPRHIDRRWVGAPFDRAFLAALEACDGVDLCGERGEYHTFVYDGPGFRFPVEFLLDEPVEIDGYRIRPARPSGAL
jgi:uncharacterized protein (TIGR00290 family)